MFVYNLWSYIYKLFFLTDRGDLTLSVLEG
jgi:hypothetical protein